MIPVPPVFVAQDSDRFATSQQPSQALDLWGEMRREGVQSNAVVYNAFIDAH